MCTDDLGEALGCAGSGDGSVDDVDDVIGSAWASAFHISDGVGLHSSSCYDPGGLHGCTC